MNKYFAIINHHHYRTGVKIGTQVVYIEAETEEKAISIAWSKHGSDSCTLEKCFEIKNNDGYIVYYN